MKRLCTALLAAAGCMPALAVALQCSENKVTNAMQCVAPSEVRATSIENVRFAPLYMGGPNNVRKTAFTVHTNCKTGVTHLKDRDGVSFGGGDGNETQAVRELRAIVCEAPVKAKK